MNSYEKQCGGSEKIKIEIPYIPAISFLGISKKFEQFLEQIFIHPCS